MKSGTEAVSSRRAGVPVVVAALLAGVLSLPARGQGVSERVGVLLVGREGGWDRERQQRWRPWGEGREPPWASRLVIDGRRLLREEAVRLLSLSERDALLSRPGRLLASRHARRVMDVSRVLLLFPEEEGSIPALFYDLETGRRWKLRSPRLEPLSESRRYLLEEAVREGGPPATPVNGNPQSRLYHIPDAPHFSPRAVPVPFADRRAAEDAGYAACTICFPEENRALRRDPLDRELGRYVARAIERRYRVSQDPQARDRLQRVGRRILTANRFPDTGYRFVVLDSDELNAFSAPTGPVYVTSGLLRVLESDDELAAVLAHELSHSERRHVRSLFEQAQGMSWLGAILTAATGSPWARAASDLASLLLSTAFSRSDELEADRDAVLLAFGAGYHPEDFLLTLLKLQQLEEQRPRQGPGWLDTHPSHEERLEQVRGLLSRLEPLRRWVRELSREDPGLAEELRRDAEAYLEDPGEVERFLDCYGRLRLKESGGEGERAGSENIEPTLRQAPGEDR